MKLANEAVKLFLKSIPCDSEFGIYSFGSSGNWTPNIKEYNNKTRDDTLNLIDKFKADMGGTNILEPL